MSTPLPSVFVCGAGSVAQAFVRDLSAASVPVLGVWSRRLQAAESAGQGLGVRGFSGAFPNEIRQAEVVIVAVRDAAIASLAEALQDQDCLSASAVLIHCSGALSSTEAFSNVRERVGGIATLHPLAAISPGSERAGPRSLVGLRFGIEGDRTGTSRARSLCGALSGVVLPLQASQMAGYHAAASMASNFLVTLLDSSKALLESQGIDSEIAMPALCDLALGSIENVRERGLPDALTGPIRRGDAETLRRHIRAMRANRPELIPMYRELARATLELALQCGDLSASEAEEIRQSLE